MSGSGSFKSSFDHRRKKQNAVKDDLPPEVSAIPSPSNAQEDNLLNSQPGSFESMDMTSRINGDNRGYFSGTESSYKSKSDSYEPKTPDDHEQIEDSQEFEQSNTTNDDAVSIENPSDLLLYEPQDRGEGISDNLEIPEYSQYSINDFDSFEPSLYDTVLLHKGEPERSAFENLPIEKRYSHYSQDPLSFLMSQEKLIQSQLQRNIKSHTEVSKKGLSSKSIRLNIENCLKSLASVYQSIGELYMREKKRKSIILNSFERWEKNKKYLTNKVQDIRSDNNEEGYRLKQLLNEAGTVDEEIEQLEKRLNQLKEKKKVLKNEIAQSQSVIESRTSSYLESLREVEKVERDAIIKLSQERSIESGLSDLSLGFPVADGLQAGQRSGLKSFLMNMSASIHQSFSDINADPVIEMVQRQIASYGDCINSFHAKEISFDEASVIWANVSGILNNLEGTLSRLLGKQSTDTKSIEDIKTRIVDHLRETQDILQERLESIKSMNEVLKSLIRTEISILDMGIGMIAPDQRKPQIESPQSSPPPKQPSPPTINPTVAKFTISDKALASSPVDATLAVGAGSFAPSVSLKSQLKSGLFKKDFTRDDKQTKRD